MNVAEMERNMPPGRLAGDILFNVASVGIGRKWRRWRERYRYRCGVGGKSAGGNGSTVRQNQRRHAKTVTRRYAVSQAKYVRVLFEPRVQPPCGR